MMTGTTHLAPLERSYRVNIDKLGGSDGGIMSALALVQLKIR